MPFKKFQVELDENLQPRSQRFANCRGETKVCKTLGSLNLFLLPRRSSGLRIRSSIALQTIHKYPEDNRWDAGNIIYKETCTEDICGSFLVPVAEADWDLAVVSQYVLHGGLQSRRLVSSVSVVRSLAITHQYF